MTGSLRFWRRQRADAAPRACPICLESVPADNDAVALHCGHAFCRDCVASYIELKIREHLVERDQLVCPVVECRRRLRGRDLRRVLATPEAFDQYQRTLQRVRDEKNPRARWCPRADCSELVVCWSSRAKTFTCPKCATVGCGRCRGLAHAPGERCHGTPGELGDEDQSEALYRQWEQSLARGSWTGTTTDTRAVRACPKCHMRIWKNGGCKHMTCTYCQHEFCWERAAKWSARHYACGTATAAVPAETGETPQVGFSGGDILLLLFGLVFVVVIRHAVRSATTRGSADRPAVATAAPRVPQIVAYRQHELQPRRRTTLPAWVRRVEDTVSLAMWTLLEFLGRIAFEISRAVHNALDWVCAWIQRSRRTPSRVWRGVDALKRVAHAAAPLYVRSLLWLLTWIGRAALAVVECAACVGQCARVVYNCRIASRRDL